MIVLLFPPRTSLKACWAVFTRDFANFVEIARMLHRQPKHLLQFLFAELGTSGAIDGSNQLIIKGLVESPSNVVPKPD